jgi:Tfp pilus assembly protein PilO
MSQKPTKSTPSELILQQLRHPLKLRLTILLIAILAWYLAFFMPIGEQTQTTTARIARERKRITTAREVETLRKSLAPHLELIRAGADLNELMRHVIDHLRTSPRKLIDLKPEASKDLGPYQTIGVQLTLEGQFAEIDAFLGWVESGDRPLRVDSIKIDPDPKKTGGLKAQVTLLGLAEKTPAAAKEKPEVDKDQPAKTVK